MWSGHVRPVHRRRGLPGWLSVPVVVAGAIVAPLSVLALIFAPVVVGLTALPLTAVFLTFSWLDRIEPEPWAGRIHATLWGATVAALVAATVNTLVQFAAGDVAALVVSAPLVEETMKAGGVLWAATRRREVGTVMDGVVYAGWVAAGFAATENVLYLLDGAASGALATTFVVRALLTPFAHPLFTLPVGVAIGWAVVQRRSPWPWAALGLVPAVALHAAWNTTAVLGGDVGGVVVALVLLLGFVGLFTAAAVGLGIARGREARRFVRYVPLLTSRYALRAEELYTFSDWRRLLATRRALPGRASRRRFDAVHAAVARLAALQDRPGGPTPDEERRAIEALASARAGRPVR
jgi:protease PrsW